MSGGGPRRARAGEPGSSWSPRTATPGLRLCRMAAGSSRLATTDLPEAGAVRVSAAFHVINAFGKAVGGTQLQELGVLETPVALTNTLSVGSAFEGLVRHALAADPEIGRSPVQVNRIKIRSNPHSVSAIRYCYLRRRSLARCPVTDLAGGDPMPDEV